MKQRLLVGVLNKTDTYLLTLADNPNCSEIGASVMAKGGNAIDAAVSCAICQGVLNPFASGNVL